MDKLDEVFGGVDEKFTAFVDEMLKNIPDPEPTPLQSSKQIKEQSRSTLIDLFTGKDIRQRMEQGFAVINKELSGHETPLVIDGIKAEWAKCVELLVEKMKNKSTEAPAEGEFLPSFQEQFSISDATIECFYQCGIRAYEHKNYQEAADVFYVVSSIDYRRHNVWMAFGLAEKNLNHPQLALTAFIMASLTNIENPFAFLYSAECYIALGEKEGAEKCIQAALELVQGKSDSESRTITDRLLLIKKSIS